MLLKSDNVELVRFVAAILKMATGKHLSPTLKNVYRLPFSKWPPQYCKNSTLFDINTI
jgi:hypothetical protein